MQRTLTQPIRDPAVGSDAVQLAGRGSGPTARRLASPGGDNDTCTVLSVLRDIESER